MNKLTKGFLIGGFVVVLLLAIIALVPLALQGAAVATTKTEVIQCSNWVLKCSENDCSNQCGKYVSSQGGVLMASYPVNNGKGCECSYQ